jgi:ketosteroid isomerase-like protein
MSQENVEIVRRAVDAFNRGELETLAEMVAFYDTDIEYHEHPDFIEIGTFRGRDALAEHWRQFLDAFEDYRFEIENLIDVHDDVVVFTHQHGHGKESGLDFELRSAWVFSFSDKKLTKIRTYPNRAEALEAVGLSE